MKSIKDLLSVNRESYKKLGLCLSGGGALGIAHIGVLQALNDNQIYPTHIAGSSMGSIIGAIYAAGYTPAQMLDMIKKDRLYKLSKILSFQPAFWKTGLSDHSSIYNLLEELIPNNSFEKLELPLYVCVTNLSDGNWEIKSSGDDLHKWVAASSSIPGIFNPVKENKKLYVDGGLLNNMPSQPLTEVCDHIIGSDVLAIKSSDKQIRPRDILVHSVRIAQAQNSESGRKNCDFLIEPSAVEKHHEFSFEAYLPIYHHGYRSAVQYIAANPDILKLRKEQND